MRYLALKRGVAITGMVLGALVAPQFTLTGSPAYASSDTPGAVYTSTNSPAGNSVEVFDRAADGSLTPAGSYATGGTGTGAGLGSQSAIALSDNNRWLFVVNAGSNSISSFAVEPDGLRLAGTVDSGGQQPISIAVHEDVIYVLNAAGGGNISGFRLAEDGSLSALTGSTRPLSPGVIGPAQVAFGPGGSTLVVTEKFSNLIDTYTVQDGLASQPMVYTSIGREPFGFAVDRRGHVIVSDAMSGAVSSYTLSGDGSLDLVTGPVTDLQGAPCWVAVTGDGRYAYAANAASGTISGYSVAHDGSISLLSPDGISGTTGAGPTDMAMSNNNRHLYVLNNRQHTIVAFGISEDGSLSAEAGAAGLPPSMVGLAAD